MSHLQGQTFIRELGVVFILRQIQKYAKYACMLRTTLSEMGHPQPATAIQTDNAVASGIANDKVKQRRSKAIDMRFYWIKDHVKNGELLIHWRQGIDNNADYFTKHHSPSHHRLLRSHYLQTSS